MNNPILLQRQDGAEVTLDSLWAEQPVVLFFMRQIGCGLCRQQLVRLRSEAEHFEKIGATVAVIIMGDAQMAAGLSAMYNLPYTVYGDPGMKSYAAFDLGQTTLWNVLGPHIIVRQVGTLLEGMKPHIGSGSIRQLGGLVVVDRKGNIIYHHVASPIYHYPSWNEVLQAIEDRETVAVPAAA